MENPFKQIEPNASCPPEVKEALLSEIDVIRNALKVAEFYTGDLFAVMAALLTPPQHPGADKAGTS